MSAVLGFAILLPMPNYRRARMAGGTYFFTVVTHGRKPILTEPPVRETLRRALRELLLARPFRIDAWTLLPDHLHCLWTLPAGDAEFSTRWSTIKRLTTQGLAGRYGPLWQRRFWEHRIRDEDDLRRHLDYCYWNPVKHGWVAQVADWPYSTFRRDVRLGLYEAAWGGDGVSTEDGFGEP